MARSYWGDPSIGIDRLEKMRSFAQGETTNVTVNMSKEVELKFIKTHDDAVLPKANNTDELYRRLGV